MHGSVRPTFITHDLYRTNRNVPECRQADAKEICRFGNSTKHQLGRDVTPDCVFTKPCSMNTSLQGINIGLGNLVSFSS